MKNKLLLSSALVGGLIAGSSAIAQTSVTGSLDIHYRLQSFNGTGLGSKQGFGRESQVNIQNKGKLNNGMDYAAGFSLEFDGGNNLVPAGANTSTTLNEGHSISNENLYVDFISGTTTLTVGVDHVQNSTRHSAPMIRNVLDDVIAYGAVATDQIGARTKESMYFGIVQGIPGTGITLSAINAPQTGAFGATDQAINTGSENNPSYEIGFVGVNTLGVTGLSTHAFTNKMKAANSVASTDLKGLTYGIGYSFGQFAAGVDVHKTNRSNTTATTEVTMKNTLYGVTYAATKELSVGLIYSKNTIDAAAAPEAEKAKTVQIGYNLGPVSIVGHYDMFDGIAGSAAATAEGKQAGIRISTLF